MKARRPHGFTLLEIAVVLAILAVVVGMGVASLSGMKRRASFTTAAADVAAALRRVRAESFSRGLAAAFVVDTVGGRWWSVQATSAFTLDAFDPAAPGTVIESGTLPLGITFGPASGYAIALGTPLQGIPSLPAQSPALPYCSFCRVVGAKAGYGSMLFQANSPVQFSGGPAAMGQQFSLTETNDGVTRVQLYAIVARTGASQTFER